MKNIASKFYTIAFYICSTTMMLAQPGTGSSNNGVDTDGSSDTTPAAAIDYYVWVLAVVGLLFVFMKFRAMQNKRIQD